jgi:glutamate synthase domain-containing protein 3
METTTTETRSGRVAEIDARGVYYRELNARLRQVVDGEDAVDRVVLRNVCGQRYIGTDLSRRVDIEVHGTPGNDLAAFLNGQRIAVHGNVQDGCGNTMNEGEVVVHGHAGDILGMSMRGGRIYVRDYVGYRIGIHMKEYQQKVPALVIGGTAQDFLGEYMAGGRIVVFGLELRPGESHHANYVGTGMHNGAIYIRGPVEPYQLGKEVGIVRPGDQLWAEEDTRFLRECADEYVLRFGGDVEQILSGQFVKLYAKYLRPYGPLYSWRH